MLGDSPFLMFLLFVTIAGNILLANMDGSLCSQATAKVYAFNEINESSASYDDISKFTCQGIPSWIYVVFNAPMMLVIGLVIKKYALI